MELVDAGLDRLEAGRHRAAAGVLSFACERYPGAVGARDSLVLALLLERGTADSAGPGPTAALEEAVADARALSPSPAIWVDLAAAQVEVDAGDLGRAQESFAAFLGAWTGQPASLTPQVEVLRGRLGAGERAAEQGGFPGRSSLRARVPGDRRSSGVTRPLASGVERRP